MIIILTGIIVYLVVLTYYLNRYKILMSKLVQNPGGENLADILRSIVSKLDTDRENIDQIRKEISRQAQLSLKHVQKVSLLRFNPFSDTGGDQSFVMAFLDADDSGIVLTSLHNRGQSRWYAKSIVHGKGLSHELSNEEIKAIKIAHEGHVKH